MPESGERRGRRALALALVALLAAAPASAQLPDLGVSLPAPATPDLPGLAGPRDAAGLPAGIRRLADLRRLRLDALLRDNRRQLEVDERGAVVVRGQVLAIDPTPRGLELASQAGFTVVREDRLDDLGVVLVILATPKGQDARRAVRRLRRADPDGEYDFNHLYAEAGGIAGAPEVAGKPAGSARGGGVSAPIGLLDSGVQTAHPALAGVRIEQRGFAPGGVRPAAHGTAAASLIAGRSGAFRGSAAGALLHVADVYGTGPTGGSTDAVLRGLGWLAAKGVKVINVSLVGPPNGALRLAVRNLSAKGVVIVAAVGNDGPAAPPLYPASWPEVVAVTAVDARGKVLLEAGRAEHTDFAAPGADMAAAGAGGGFVRVRGTSFAAPVVTGLLGRLMLDRNGPAAIEALGRQARDLGARGPDRVYGRGLVGAEYRVPPAAVKAR